MKYIQSIIPALMIMLLSCGNMKNDTDQNGEGSGAKQFTSAAAAATAARQDMLDAMDKVDFGVNKEKLRASTPGAPVSRYNVDWDALLKSGDASAPEQIIGPEIAQVVPFINGNDVVAVVSIVNNNQQYSIAGLGDKQVSTELDVVRKADSAGMQSEIKIYQVPNLEATIYAIARNNTIVYYTSYNNSSLRQAMDGPVLMKMLKNDAQVFQNMYGDQLKKGHLGK